MFSRYGFKVIRSALIDAGRQWQAVCEAVAHAGDRFSIAILWSLHLLIALIYSALFDWRNLERIGDAIDEALIEIQKLRDNEGA